MIDKLNKYISEINLASQSPARFNLLKNQGLTVRAYPTMCNEDHSETEPEKVVELLASRKLKAYMDSENFNPEVPAIACDTLLWFENSLIGKAHSDDEAYEQIRRLSSKTHQVFSGYALYFGGKVFTGWDCADVTFKGISPKALELYIASHEWKGAAGSYHVDGLASHFIERVDGDISTVMGLPLSKVSDIIKLLCQQPSA